MGQPKKHNNTGSIVRKLTRTKSGWSLVARTRVWRCGIWVAAVARGISSTWSAAITWRDTAAWCTTSRAAATSSSPRRTIARCARGGCRRAVTQPIQPSRSYLYHISVHQKIVVRRQKYYWYNRYRNIEAIFLTANSILYSRFFSKKISSIHSESSWSSFGVYYNISRRFFFITFIRSHIHPVRDGRLSPLNPPSVLSLFPASSVSCGKSSVLSKRNIIISIVQRTVAEAVIPQRWQALLCSRFSSTE